MISVRKIDETPFDVTVQGGVDTNHRVMVDPDYHAALTGGSVPPETLVERSFEFLLEREPNTSILRRFELPTISRYFPEYERVMKDRLGK